jgi:hypothetical protein
METRIEGQDPAGAQEALGAPVVEGEPTPEAEPSAGPQAEEWSPPDPKETGAVLRKEWGEGFPDICDSLDRAVILCDKAIEELGPPSEDATPEAAAAATLAAVEDTLGLSRDVLKPLGANVATLIQRTGAKSLSQLLDRTRLRLHPAILRALSERPMAKYQRRVYDKKDPANDAGHPLHKSATAKMERLRNRVYKGGNRR